MSEYVKALGVRQLPPGQGTTVELRGTRIAIFNVDGNFFAIDDTCPHMLRRSAKPTKTHCGWRRGKPSGCEARRRSPARLFRRACTNAAADARSSTRDHQGH
jgi:hypothetical protein